MTQQLIQRRSRSKERTTHFADEVEASQIWPLSAREFMKLPTSALIVRNLKRQSPNRSKTNRS